MPDSQAARTRSHSIEVPSRDALQGGAKHSEISSEHLWQMGQWRHEVGTKELQAGRYAH